MSEIIQESPVVLQNPLVPRTRGRPVGARNNVRSQSSTQRDLSAFELAEQGNNSRRCSAKLRQGRGKCEQPLFSNSRTSRTVSSAISVVCDCGVLLFLVFATVAHFCSVKSENLSFRLGLMTDDLLEQPAIHAEKASVSKKRAGRQTSTLWELFTDDLDSQRRISSTCRHCHKFLVYHKKSERVKDHLQNCKEFAIAHDGHGRRFSSCFGSRRRRALERTYEKVRIASEKALKLSNRLGCVITDASSNTNNESIVNYMIVSDRLSQFLESIATEEQSHTAEFIADDLDRVIQSLTAREIKIAGAVTDNTATNRKAWD
ncbi:hypothetical protein BASA62_002267 [Batrachochytrium salamandrivorans]|nr:hypothetical protein BASA62_002267 [Batrachochytrium salamandrivorans]